MKSEKNVRAGKKARRKGGRAAREVCKILSEFWGELKSFTPKVRQSKGDEDVETPKDFPFTIEIKDRGQTKKVMTLSDLLHGAGINDSKIFNKLAPFVKEFEFMKESDPIGLYRLFACEGKPRFWDFWDQAKSQAVSQGKYTMLIFRQSGKKWLVACNAPLFMAREFDKWIFDDKLGQKFMICSLANLLEHSQVEHFRIINNNLSKKW